MIVKPRIRGFICTTAHPAGCARNVEKQIEFVQAQPPVDGPKNVLVLGASGGYGLASRVCAAFGAGAATLGVSFEKSPTQTKTGTAGWYNNIALEEAAKAQGLFAKTLDGDAFSDEMKTRVVEIIKTEMGGSIDMLVYSLASPVRVHPRTGELHRNAIKPLGEALQIKTLNVDKGLVHEVDLEPATPEETAGTITVMGGEDWEFWISALREAGVLSEQFRTVAYTYIGSELTWPIYWHGTLGKAKEDLDRAAQAITSELQSLHGQARVVSLKAIVSQASSAIPVVPLYASLLFRVMKNANLHEEIIEHIYRLFATQLATGASENLDEKGRIRMDDVELSEPIQGELKRLWPLVTTENLPDYGDLEGFRTDFLKIFGFGFDGVDYDAEQDPTLGRQID
jgi:enoyl-[acyl-carrier protein] reductase/trans-2-enoyl-CoA reductase (NAD+)